MDLFSGTARIGIYNLREGSHVRCELHAYEAAFALLLPPLGALESAGVHTGQMAREQLFALCRAYGVRPPVTTTDTALRGYAQTLLSMSGLLRETAALTQYLSGLGCNITLTEGADGSITASGDVGVLFETAQIERLLARLLPTGAKLRFDFGLLTWALFDSADLTAATLDAKDFTWAWFDRNGHLLPGEG